MIRLIAMREIKTRGRTKLYIGITALLALAPLLGLVALSQFGGGSDEPREVTIALAGVDDATLAEEVESSSFGQLDADVELFDDQDAAEAAVEDGQVDVALIDGALVWGEFADPDLSIALSGTLQRRAALERASAAGLDQTELAAILTPEPVAERFLSEEQPNDEIAKQLAGVATTMLVFLSVQIYGAMMLMGVVEEKSSRVIEVLLPHVTPRSLLAGKALGLGSLALFQLACIAAGLVGGLALTDRLSLPSSVLASLPLFLACLIGGFVLYATIYAAAGSLVSRQEDAQQASLPIVLPLLVGYMVGLAGSDSIVGQIAAIFPLTSPMVLPGRIANGQAPVWEVVLSLGLLLAAVWLVLTVGGRIYSEMLLRTGTRITWRDAMKTLRN